MTDEIIGKIITSKNELSKIPIISGLDFGHTSPYMTFPVGGKVRLKANEGEVKIEIYEH
jgi:muramoyltetrapeptide carboxypeptidase LdcA involved in peptidoglycan recycling